MEAENELKLHQERFVKSISIHPRYSGTPEGSASLWLHNDFALLHMTVEFKLDEHLDTICLPEFPNERESNYQKTGCVVTGWGKDAFNGNYQRAMKQIELPIVDNGLCQKQFRQTDRLSNDFQLHDSFICAGGEEGKDACTGDGGGPLVCPSLYDDDTYVLAGVVAWGIGCGRRNVPGAYAAITDGLCFIHWATRCKHGIQYAENYNFDQCNTWIDDEISQLESSSYRFSHDYLIKARELKNSCVVDLSMFERTFSK